jgi:putative DNA primase/helicase
MIYNEAAAADDDQARKAIVVHSLRSESRTRIEAMIELAMSEPGVPILPDELDANAWLLNTESGTVDLRTGEVCDHCREDLITKLAAVRYDPKAACPIFEAFMDKIFAGNRRLIKFVQRAVGSSLTSDIREQVIFIVHGCGSNGKSTLADVLLAMLGDYAQQTPTGSLMVKRGEAIPNDMARLKGARLVAAVESDEGRRLSEALVKQLTGGDRIAARFMRAEWFEFKPSFKIWLATNHKPVIRGTDHAIWRRIRLIPFDVTIPDAQQDKRLPEKLREELPGILNWAIEGCLAWQRDGLGISEEVTAATAAYREEMDVIGGWVTDHCVTGDAVRTKASDLYAAYRTWCENAGEKPVSQRKLASLLRERGFTPDKDKHARYWLGIGLVTQQQPVTHDDAVFGMNGHDPSLVELSGTKRHEASPVTETLPNDNWGEL